MASIKDMGNGKYRIFICDGFKPDGRVNRTSKTIYAKSKKDAERQAQAMEVDFKRGQQVQPSNASTFFRGCKRPKKPTRLMLRSFGSSSINDGMGTGFGITATGFLYPNAR